jgi:hypothetical protein
MTMKIKPKDQCRWDLVSLSEVMLRLDPGDGRIATTRQFQAWEGGGEYNVSRALKRCFGLNTTVGHRTCRQPHRQIDSGFNLSRRRRSRLHTLGGVRRRRPPCS